MGVIREQKIGGWKFISGYAADVRGRRDRAGGASVRRAVRGLLSTILMAAASLDAAAQRDAPPIRTGAEISPIQAPSSRSGFQDFVVELAGSSLRLVSRDNLPPLLLGGGVAAGARGVDHDVREYFDGGDRFGMFEKGVGEQLGRGVVVAGAVGGLWVAGRFHGSDEFSRFTEDLAEATALNGLITFGLKHGFRRIRPNGANRLSLPSGHTSAAFAAAAVVDRYYGPAASIAAYAAAVFVGASRLDASEHYLSDVIAGATVGYIVGATVTRAEAPEGSVVTWTPIVSSRARAVGLELTWRLGE